MTSPLALVCRSHDRNGRCHPVIDQVDLEPVPLLSHQPVQSLAVNATTPASVASSAQVTMLRYGELRALNQRVGGSIPSRRTTSDQGQHPDRRSFSRSLYNESVSCSVPHELQQPRWRT
jgi:hypothetical protein